jgi:hypothetical protein
MIQKFKLQPAAAMEWGMAMGISAPVGVQFELAIHLVYGLELVVLTTENI